MLKRNLTSELVKKFNEYILKINEYIHKNKYDEALNLIDETFKEIFRLSSKFFNSFSDENLMDMIKTDGTVNADKCIMMAKLLETEADIFENQNDSNQSFYLNLKSLNLFLEAYLNKSDECDLQNYFEDIDVIIDKVCEYKIPLELNYKLVDYNLKNNQYDKAEDLLYEIMSENGFKEDFLRKGIDFYESLLAKNNDDLVSGNVTREELNNSLSCLKNKLEQI